MGGSASFECTCLPGFTGNGVDTCVNIDECAVGLAACPEDSSCVDTVGSFVCVCRAGYTIDTSGLCVSTLIYLHIK